MKDAATQTSEEDTEEVEVPWFLDNQPGVVIESEESGQNPFHEAPSYGGVDKERSPNYVTVLCSRWF